MPDAKVSMVCLLRQGAPADRSTWPALNVWMADALETMQTLFRPIAKALDASEAPPPASEAALLDDALSPEAQRGAGPAILWITRLVSESR